MQNQCSQHIKNGEFFSYSNFSPNPTSVNQFSNKFVNLIFYILRKQKRKKIFADSVSLKIMLFSEGIDRTCNGGIAIIVQHSFYESPRDTIHYSTLKSSSGSVMTG